MMREIYALGSDRSVRFVRAFLDRFLPDRERVADEYEVPEHARQPSHLFLTDDDIMDYLEHHPWESYGLYWRDPDPDGRRLAMAFYTVDRKIILGLVEYPDVATQRL